MIKSHISFKKHFYCLRSHFLKRYWVYLCVWSPLVMSYLGSSCLLCLQSGSRSLMSDFLILFTCVLFLGCFHFPDAPSPACVCVNIAPVFPLFLLRHVVLPVCFLTVRFSLLPLHRILYFELLNNHNSP